MHLCLLALLVAAASIAENESAPNKWGRCKQQRRAVGAKRPHCIMRFYLRLTECIVSTEIACRTLNDDVVRSTRRYRSQRNLQICGRLRDKWGWDSCAASTASCVEAHTCRKVKAHSMECYTRRDGRGVNVKGVDTGAAAAGAGGKCNIRWK